MVLGRLLLLELIPVVGGQRRDDGMGRYARHLSPGELHGAGARSPVLDRGGDWNANFFDPTEIRDTHFPPVGALAEAYYSSLLLHHSEWMRVDGPDDSAQLFGLQHLGPVLHAIADACVPQHVLGSMALRHQDWENWLESSYQLTVVAPDNAQISAFLNGEPFTGNYIWTGGDLSGCFPASFIVSRIAGIAADRLCASTGKSYQELWQSKQDFWDAYMSSPNLWHDATYLYNLAVAGAVHAIERASEDLKARGMIETDTGAPVKTSQLHSKVTKRIPASALLSQPGAAAEFVLGFPPSPEFGLAGEFARFMAEWDNVARAKPAEVTTSLQAMQIGISKEYDRRAELEGHGFSAFQAARRSREKFEVSSAFGLGTFRLPTKEECAGRVLSKAYMDRLDAHAYKACLVNMTVALAMI